jgi:transposase-like protein
MSGLMEVLHARRETLGGADHCQAARGREAHRPGDDHPYVAKKVGITDQTFYRWRIRYGALKEDEAKRLLLLEQENSRLKRIVAEQALDISMLRDLQRGKF